MGLDACVYCDCFETDNLRLPPPFPELVYVAEDGQIECRDTNYYEEFDEWRKNCACAHKDCEIASHYIGNITRVAHLREKLSEQAEASVEIKIPQPPPMLPALFPLSSNT